MQGVIRVGILVGVAACHTTEMGNPVDAAPTTDVAPSAVGLRVPWSTKPSVIPGNVNNNITITSMLFRMANVRVIGDAAPGDPRTSKDNFEISWAQGQTPAALTFGDAPSGLYSRITIVADGNLLDYSYEIYGTVMLAGVSHNYKIHDRSPIAASFATDTMLDPGKAADTGIRIELDKAINTVDFTMLTPDNGVLELDTLDSQMGDFRTKMLQAFVSSHDD